MRASGRRHRRLERIALLGFAALLVLFGTLSFAGAATAANTPRTDDGIGLVATVAPAEPGDGGSGSGGGGNYGSSSTDTPEMPVSPPTEAGIPTFERQSLGGIVFVSGLNSGPVFPFNPADSSVALRLTVRNDAKTTFSSTAKFWVETPFGSRVGTVGDVVIKDLKPNETRNVVTTISGLGQWPVLHAQVKFVPPHEVDGKKLTPVTRDAFVAVPPVLAIGIGLFGIGLFFLLRFVRIELASTLVKAAA